MRQFKVTASSLHLRSGPGQAYPALKTIPMGATLMEVDAALWIFVRANGAVGWVHRNYIEEVRVEAKIRPARSLDVLLAQVDSHAPKRDRSYDGWIGDAAHAARKSDHNPLGGVVHARDITHDPAHGMDAAELGEALRKSKDARLDYVIHAGRIFSSTVKPWVWRPYDGADSHKHHIHISVVDSPALADDPRPWSLPWLPLSIP